jgi:hypothetical protein
MDEDRKSYLLHSIWNMSSATDSLEDQELYLTYTNIAEIFYKAGLVSDDEYDELVKDFEENDSYLVKRMRGEIDPVKEREEWVENVVGVLCGCSSGVATDAIIEYCKCPDIYWKDRNMIKEFLCDKH